ncbi:MAG: 16S rRNA (cytidine(1402)-2'-O)-methyltransferase [Nitrospira sp.]|nr:16S rRNA (cytidine(1402)-2'-O)-methyltransferase [Nitrospira sp.]
MQRERSQQTTGESGICAGQPGKPGTLSLVAVPIGHLDDLTVRALRTLAEADVIASEDPAATRALLAHHGVTATLTSYGPTNIHDKVAVLIHRLQQGAHVALVSDRGSPVVADPGSLLVKSAHRYGIRVISVPGPSALTAAVAAAGLASRSWVFEGPLPETPSALRHRLQTRLQDKTPTVAFCAAQSIVFAVRTIAAIAPRRHIALVCDLTKPHERIIQGTAAHVLRKLDNALTTQDITLIVKEGRPVPQIRTGPFKRGSGKRNG